MLPLPCLASPQQCRHDAVASIQTCRQIRHRHADLDWRTVTSPSDVHEAKLCFNHDIVTGSVGIGPCLSVAGDGRVYKGWVDLAECCIVHAILLE